MIDETLSPTWDELLVFGKLLVYGRKEDIKRRPPLVTVEIYDYDKVSQYSVVKEWQGGNDKVRPLVLSSHHHSSLVMSFNVNISHMTSRLVV